MKIKRCPCPKSCTCPPIARPPLTPVSPSVQGRLLPRIDYKDLILIDARGPQRDPTGPAMSAAMGAVLETEPWPLAEALRSDRFYAAEVQKHKRSLDVWIEFAGRKGPAKTVIHLPLCWALLSVADLRRTLSAVLREQVMTCGIDPADVDTAPALAFALKYTHPGYRLTRRIECPLTDPLLAAVFGRMEAITGMRRPFDTACVVNAPAGEHIANLLRTHDAREITAVDACPVSLALTERRFPGVRAVQGCIEDAPRFGCQMTASADLVLASRLLQTRQVDVHGALDGIAHILKPGGWLIVSVPNKQPEFVDFDMIDLPHRRTAPVEQAQLVWALHSSPDFTLKAIERAQSGAVEDFILARRT